MTTQPPRTPTREEQRRLSIRTLIIASVASAAAAVVTSQFWVHGTWVAAAMTPVIVAVVSELLHKPTEAVARRMTTERTVILPDEREGGPGPEPIPEQVKVYGGGGRSRTRKFAIGLVAATAALGFVIGALALTVPELLTGQPIGKGSGGTTIFGGHKDENKADQPSRPQQTTPTETKTQTLTAPPKTQTQPKQQTQTQPTTPQATPTQPAPQGQQPGKPAP